MLYLASSDRSLGIMQGIEAGFCRAKLSSMTRTLLAAPALVFHTI